LLFFCTLFHFRLDADNLSGSNKLRGLAARNLSGSEDNARKRLVFSVTVRARARARLMNTPLTTLPIESATLDPRVKRSQTAACFAAFISLGLVTAAIGPTLPGLAQLSRVGMREISFLFTAQSLGYLFGSVLGGRLFDRVKGNPLMGIMLITMAAMAALVPLIQSLLLVIVVILILGTAEGVLDVGGNTLLVWVHRHRVGPFMNALHFFFGIGAVLSPVIVAQAILISAGIDWAYWALALMILPVALWVIRVPSPLAQRVVKESGATPVNTTLVVLIACFLFLYVGAEVGFSGWIYTYAVALGIGGETTSAYLTSAFWGAFTLGRLLGIPLASRFRPSSILLCDLGGSVACALILWLCSQSILAVWLGSIGLGLSMASVFPAVLAFAEQHMTVTARMTGRVIVGASLGCMVIPWLIGQLFESVGPRALMFTVLADLLAAVVIFIMMLIHSARSPVND
jgi:MFS transporter, FHS family, Na+ dependent glucose transporter 1